MEEEEYETALQSVNERIELLKESRVAGECQQSLRLATAYVQSPGLDSQLTPSADIAQLLHLLALKSKIFAVTDQSAKGLSLALRVASTAQQHSLISVLMTAFGVLGRILVDLSEFDAARETLEAALPHVSFVLSLLQRRAKLVIGSGHARPTTKSGDVLLIGRCSYGASATARSITNRLYQAHESCSGLC